MTDIAFKCPQCGQTLQANAGQASNDFLCPACRHHFTVPGQTEATVRPTTVTVFGILNIVFGALGLLCAPLSFYSGTMNANPAAAVGGFKAWIVGSSVFGLMCSGVLIAAGIGLLKSKAWARAGSVAYGWFMIVFSLVGIGVNCVMINAGVMGSSTEQMAAGYASMVIGGLASLLYPILLIIFMTRPGVIAACTE